MIHCIPVGAVVWTLAVSSAPASDAREPEAPSRLEQGEAALERGELRRAADAFTAYYRGLPPEERASPAGEYVVMYAAGVFDRAWDEDADVDHLRASRAVLQAFVHDVESVHGDAQPELVQAAHAKIEELDRRIEAASASEAPEDDPEPVEEIEPEIPTEPLPPKPDVRTTAPPRDRPPSRVPAVALLASGTTVVVGGVAMLAAGLAGATTQRARARLDARCEADGVDDEACARGKGSDAAQAFIARAERTDRGVALASIVPLGVGTALLVTGAVLLNRSKRSQARIGWGSRADRRGSGLFLSGRF